jgi:hypothetical protein
VPHEQFYKSSHAKDLQQKNDSESLMADSSSSLQPIITFKRNIAKSTLQDVRDKLVRSHGVGLDAEVTYTLGNGVTISN